MTAGQFDVPFKISKFVNELTAGFRLLNLKNDNLRKRFDAIKYGTNTPILSVLRRIPRRSKENRRSGVRYQHKRVEASRIGELEPNRT